MCSLRVDLDCLFVGYCELMDAWSAGLARALVLERRTSSNFWSSGHDFTAMQLIVRHPLRETSPGYKCDIQN
jgi:hypothetical protein